MSEVIAKPEITNYDVISTFAHQLECVHLVSSDLVAVGIVVSETRYKSLVEYIRTIHMDCIVSEKDEWIMRLDFTRSGGRMIFRDTYVMPNKIGFVLREYPIHSREGLADDQVIIEVEIPSMRVKPQADNEQKTPFGGRN